jgi:hypothetical protein
MGMMISLETESGTVLDSISDPSNSLHQILPDNKDVGYVHINCIDWYGDTMFNVLQIPRFLSEWNQILPAAQTRGAASLHARVLEMAQRCLTEVHVYLKFRGD